ncbi:hypothetical protein [Niallia circulans]|uniref:hypothetical protein n=1 Tax=Niallia circulans TaxID=1397 RepID=UPI00156182FB|nr:hypothetical protein [Niallia circulans]NRG32543.1 hypothetical protein [Niallia circulans]
MTILKTILGGVLVSGLALGVLVAVNVNAATFPTDEQFIKTELVEANKIYYQTELDRIVSDTSLKIAESLKEYEQKKNNLILQSEKKKAAYQKELEALSKLKKSDSKYVTQLETVVSVVNDFVTNETRMLNSLGTDEGKINSKIKAFSENKDFQIQSLLNRINKDTLSLVDKSIKASKTTGTEEIKDSNSILDSVLQLNRISENSQKISISNLKNYSNVQEYSIFKNSLHNNDLVLLRKTISANTNKSEAAKLNQKYTKNLEVNNLTYQKAMKLVEKKSLDFTNRIKQLKTDISNKQNKYSI